MELSRKVLRNLVLSTFLLLFYVHEQVSVLQVSYSIEKKERELARLNEAYKIAKFNVLRLRSPQALNQRMKQLSLDLTVPTDQKVIKVLKLQTIPVEEPVSWRAPIQFMSWLHMIKEAQAKTFGDGKQKSS